MSDDVDQSPLERQLEAIRERSAELPWYRRPRKLRRQVTGTLAATALVAVGLFGGLSYYASDNLLRQGAYDQLNSVAESRAVRIETGANRVLSQVATLAADLGVADALADFDAGFAGLDEPLTASQQTTLDRFYEERVVTPINETGLATITVDDAEPTSDAGRWVQYHHVVPDVDPASDTSAYGDAIAEHDAFLTSIAETIGAGDLLMVSARTGDIVYSTDKRIDLGSSMVDGAFAESVLGQLLNDDLGRVRAGRGVLSNFAIYIPNGGQPSSFAAATVRDGTKIIGALAIEIRGATIDSVTTGAMDWDSLGLSGGESYVVSSDLILQSISREWIEDPQGYLDSVDDPEERRLIEIFGSPVGIQTVDTEAVNAAFLGEQFRGRTTNYLGRETYSSSTKIEIPGVDWVVVTDVPVAEAREAANDFIRQMLIVALIVIPIAALIGLFIARRLSRPIGPSVSAARSVAEGERHLELPPLGNDEFGDLGRRLTRTAAALEVQETALTEEFEHKRQMMLSVLPPHLVDGDGAVSGSGDAIDIATAIALVIDTDNLDLDPDELSELLSSLGAIVGRLLLVHGLERIRVAADRGLYLAGIGEDDSGAETAVAFVRDLWDGLRQLGQATGLSAPVHIGISTGAVATGVLTGGNLTFGAWGEPIRRALAISALSTATEVLLDEPTRAELGNTVEMTAVDGLVDLDGHPMAVYALSSVTVSSEG